MARRDDDIEALLAEVDANLRGGGGASAPARRGAAVPERQGKRSERLARRGKTAAVGAALAAALVFAVFALVPLLGAFSGAAGAALGTFIALLLVPRRR